MKTAMIESLDYLGRGVARVDSKVVFIEGGLPGEKVIFRVIGGKKNFTEAVVERLLETSSDRVTPLCQYYEKCGGCSLQHLSGKGQLVNKEFLWLEQLSRFAQLQPDIVHEPLCGTDWGYRTRTKLSVIYQGKENIVIGFKARRSHTVIDVMECPILDPRLADVLPDLKSFLKELLPARATEISLHRGEDTCALALKMDKAIASSVWKRWKEHWQGSWQLWINNQCLDDDGKQLCYTLPEFEITIPFMPHDFTQVNMLLNRAMVARVISVLGAGQDEQVVDLFSGLGNFSLPLARQGIKVIAMEGVQQMVARAMANARLHGVDEKFRAQRKDLFDIPRKNVLFAKIYKALLDPPRSGAQAVVQSIDSKWPRKLIYVSCNPATLARDAKILRQKGFRLRAGQIVNMFPQTEHVESINIFIREE